LDKNLFEKYGLLENSSRGIWSLLKNEDFVQKVDIQEVVKIVKQKDGLHP
jgi:hypothetical protein